MNPQQRAGLRGSAPLVLPTVLVGATFGLTAAPVLGAPAAVAMSALVWSGTAQFAAVGLLAAGGSALLAVGTALLANARFLPMGFALAPSMPWSPARRVLGGALLVDASFALAHRGGGRFDPVVVAWAAPLQYGAWLAGTVAGALGGGLVDDPSAWGLDAVFPVFYLGLLLAEVSPRHGGAGGRRPLVTAALAAGITLTLVPVAPPGVPVVAAAAAALLGLAARRGAASEPHRDPA